MASHHILGGKIRIFRRENSNFWQCEARLNGKRRISSKTDDLARAKDIAENWYWELRGKSQAGLLEKSEKCFEDAAKVFLQEYTAINQGKRHPRWIQLYESRLRLHLVPFFGKMGLSEINDGTMVDYEIHRRTPIKEQSPGNEEQEQEKWKPPATSTLHDEFVTVRQVLKTAVRKRWLSHVPDLTPPYKVRGKVSHRPWFSPEEYKLLYKASGEYVRTCLQRDRWSAEQTHDFILFMCNTGLRPDEAKNLQHRDIAIVDDRASGTTILEIDVRGKVGVRPCKSMPGAVEPYRRLLQRRRPKKKEAAKPSSIEKPQLPQPTDLVFPGNHLKIFNGILRRAALKLDRDGQPRTAYSLRHSYACFRLMAGAPIWDVALNMGTSVEMIEKHYAKHIKDRIDASRINVNPPKNGSRKAKPKRGGVLRQNNRSAGRRAGANPSRVS